VVYNKIAKIYSLVLVRRIDISLKNTSDIWKKKISVGTGFEGTGLA